MLQNPSITFHHLKPSSCIFNHSPLFCTSLHNLPLPFTMLSPPCYNHITPQVTKFYHLTIPSIYFQHPPPLATTFYHHFLPPKITFYNQLLPSIFHHTPKPSTLSTTCTTCTTDHLLPLSSHVILFSVKNDLSSSTEYLVEYLAKYSSKVKWSIPRCMPIHGPRSRCLSTDVIKSLQYRSVTKLLQVWRHTYR